MDRFRRLPSRELLLESERRKNLLAKSVLIRIRDELSRQPEAEQFTFPLKSAAGKLERFVLSHYPDDISARIRADHSLKLELDESVEPPELTVTIEQGRQTR